MTYKAKFTVWTTPAVIVFILKILPQLEALVKHLDPEDIDEVPSSDSDGEYNFYTMLQLVGAPPQKCTPSMLIVVHPHYCSIFQRMRRKAVALLYFLVNQIVMVSIARPSAYTSYYIYLYTY